MIFACPSIMIVNRIMAENSYEIGKEPQFKRFEKGDFHTQVERDTRWRPRADRPTEMPPNKLFLFELQELAIEIRSYYSAWVMMIWKYSKSTRGLLEAAPLHVNELQICNLRSIENPNRMMMLDWNEVQSIMNDLLQRENNARNVKVIKS